MPFKLIYERPEIHEQFSAVERVEVQIDDERSADEMLTAFRDFLNGCGFVINGSVVVEPYEYHNGDDSEQPDW